MSTHFGVHKEARSRCTLQGNESVARSTTAAANIVSRSKVQKSKLRRCLTAGRAAAAGSDRLHMLAVRPGQASCGKANAHLPSSALIFTAQGSVAISSRPSPGICARGKAAASEQHHQN